MFQAMIPLHAVTAVLVGALAYGADVALMAPTLAAAQTLTRPDAPKTASNYLERIAIGHFTIGLASYAEWIEANPPARLARPMRFRLADDTATIKATGEIDLLTPIEFQQFVAGNGLIGKKMKVELDSPGGKAIGGLMLGAAIRHYGFRTVVERRCSSACVYAFLGGLLRYMGDAGRIGIHRHSTEGGSTVPTQAQIDRLHSYFRMYIRLMGADAALQEAAQEVPHTDIRFLTREEAMAWNVATGPSGPPASARAERMPEIYSEMYAFTCGVVSLCDWRR